ncbi:hypothetical protein V5F40_22945 [Xanthobacter sp. DSM 14520]|uniref:hypothetical protein n=1 Tax=Xanthobacter autotrophicus (strain ATCC BAA-1158 / Py2) TaxID=78245 RepID=UPI00372A77D8
MQIDGPRRPEGHPDRVLDCEMMLEGAFRQLADTGERAGWTGDEVAQALLRLAQAHIEGRRADGESSGASGAGSFAAGEE